MNLSPPGHGLHRGRWWLVERSALTASVALMVACAAGDGEVQRIIFVSSSFVSAGFVARAWFRGDVSTREVLVLGGVFRLIALPLLPGLSDDGYRYLWDGLLQVTGINPYGFIPEELHGTLGGDNELYEALNSKSYYSVYPPASQLVFALGGAIAGSSWMVGWYAIKIAFVALEFVGVYALSKLVAARHLVLYMWHPLVVIEVAGQAHTEAGMVGAMLVALWAFARDRRAMSVAALTVAGWFKLYPLALLPFLLRRTGWRYILVAVIVTVVMLAPYAAPYVPGHIAQSLDLYVQSFEFNAGPYFVAKEIGYALTETDPSKSLGPALRAVFLIGLAGMFWLDRKRWPLAGAWLAVVGLLWATATTVHPWYLVGVLALLPLTLDGSRVSQFHAAAWWWLSLWSIGTYLFYTSGVGVYWTFVTVGWGGWALLLAGACIEWALPALMRRRAREKWTAVAPYLAPCRRLLDLGAGEGYVAEAAAEADADDVVIADVVDFNRSRFPLTVYDGEHLPFADGLFDAVLLAYVLHHARDPDTVLCEVRRVTSETGRIAILESIVESRADRAWLAFADRLANRVRSFGKMQSQEEHLHFGTISEWRSRFEAAGFYVDAEKRWGRRLHKRHLFMLRHRK